MKKPVSITCADRLFDLLGSLSAPRFRSVLSHWIFHCELRRLYTKKSRPGIPFPPDLSFCKFCKTPLLPRLHRRLRQVRRRPVRNLSRPFSDLSVAVFSFTTRLVEAGLDYVTIGMITGHKAKELIAHYSHKHPQSVARDAAALEQISVRRDSDPQKS